MEDEVLLAQAGRQSLESLGYGVLLANSGVEALARAEASPDLDVVLMDIDLGPGLDGPAAAGLILQSRDLPVVFLYSPSEPETVERTEGITSYGYVAKSSPPRVLDASIKMAFRLFEARRSIVESEARHAWAERVAKIGNWRIDLKTREITGSQGARLIYGLGPGTMALADIQQLFLPEYQRQGDEALADLVAKARPYDLQAKIRRASDGAIVDVRSIAEYDARNQAVYGVIQDVTEIRHNQERLGNVMAATNAGAWEWNIQTGGVVLDQVSLGFLGYGPGEASLTQISQWMNLKHPQDRAGAAALLRDHLEGKTEFFSSESRMRHKDGHWVWILGRGKVIEHDPAGRPLRMFGIHLDISERMEAEEALRASESSLSRAEAIAGTGNWKLFLDTRTMEFSKGMARIFGTRPGLLSLEEARALDLPEYHELLDRSLAELIHEGKPYDIEFAIVRLDDGKRVMVHSMADYDPESNTVFGVVQDITEQKRVQGEISTLLEEKVLILKEVQHRIKNNMSTMVSLLSLQAGLIADPQAARALLDAENRLRSMGVLYEKLYCSENLQEMSARDYLPALAEEIVADFPTTVAVELRHEVEDCPLSIKELSALGILVNEVITNSMKYAFAGRSAGLITLRGRLADGRFALEVSDDGLGLPASVDVANPTNFGLTLVAALASQLGAALRFDSQGGTTVSLDFRPQNLT